MDLRGKTVGRQPTRLARGFKPTMWRVKIAKDVSSPAVDNLTKQFSFPDSEISFVK
jgi:hypothetical protein